MVVENTTKTVNNANVDGSIASNTVWPNFGSIDIDIGEDYSVECDTAANVAELVLLNYGIEFRDLSGGGDGSLDTLDVKRMDAMTLVNLSLIQRGITRGAFVEPIVGNDGIVEFRAIDTYDGNISDVYYEISTAHNTEQVQAVMVTGGRPLPEVRELEWKPVWGEEGATIYHMRDMLDNCWKKNFSRHATIVFDDPQLTSKYEDGIDNLYEIGRDNPWDRIVGYARFINPGVNATKDTTVIYNKTAIVPIQVGTSDGSGKDGGPFMGQLQPLPNLTGEEILSGDCWAGQGIDANADNGVEIEIPEDLRYDSIRGSIKDKLVRVTNIYVIGEKINLLWWAPIGEAESLIRPPTTTTCRLTADINNNRKTTKKLEEGRHYSIAYKGEGGKRQPYVVFAKDPRFGDPFAYGQNTIYSVNPRCEYARQNEISNEPRLGAILPFSKVEGFLVTEIWAEVELETSSISIYDPNGEDNKALEIAFDLEYYLAAIVVAEPPNPAGYTGPSAEGDVIDQTPVADTDPTTMDSNFDKTEMEIYMDEMQGGGMALTWSFLTEDDVGPASKLLYNHMYSSVTEKTYTCGPNCDPILGGYGTGGGVVNAIRYSYSDNGSYTVSVTEGPTLVGQLTQIDGGPTQKMAETFNATGPIIAVAGDNIHFKVRLDGFGERWAINTAATILRKGDVVSCTVHNNPVEA